MSTAARPPLLDVRALSLGLARAGRRAASVPILRDIAFTLSRGETLGIVGESGSGKSLLALAVIGLPPRGAVLSGEIRLEGEDLLQMPEAALCRIRGRRIAMVFQEPATALNPAMRIGDQIAEGLLRHGGVGRQAARAEALRLLDRVRIAEPGRRIDAYPHELSGGQRQRVAIAIAIAPKPDLLLADEPTTALDVTVQAEILAILAELVAETGMALVLVSHDLGVVARATRRLMVIHAGTRVEAGETAEVLGRPLGPYTAGLLAAMPKRPAGPRDRTKRLAAIPGAVPSFREPPPGCRFAPRCRFRIAACENGEPAWSPTPTLPTLPSPASAGHGVRCIRADELAGRFP